MDVFEDPGVAEVYDDYGDDYEDDGYLEDYHQGDEANACEDDFQQGGGFANDFEDGEGGYPDDDDVDYIDGYFEGDSDEDGGSDQSVCEYVPAAAPITFPDDPERPLPISQAEIFDDLAARFIGNLPEDELCSLVRIGFHIQQAYWFYIDYYRGELYPHLEPVSETQLARELFVRVFGAATSEMVNACRKWKKYSRSINTYGIICLNSNLNHCIMVRTGTINIWNFPKGKINAQETKMQCAIRETYEEIGLTLDGLLKEEDYIEVQHGQKKLGMFICANVPMDLPLQPVQENETMEIRWFPIFGEHGISTMLNLSAAKKAAKKAEAAAATAAAAAKASKSKPKNGKKGRAAGKKKGKGGQKPAAANVKHAAPRFKFAQTVKTVLPKLRNWIFAEQKKRKEGRAATKGSGDNKSGGSGSKGTKSAKNNKNQTGQNATPQRTRKKTSRGSKKGATSKKNPKTGGSNGGGGNANPSTSKKKKQAKRRPSQKASTGST